MIKYLYKIISNKICNIFEKNSLKYIEFENRFITTMIKLLKKYIIIFLYICK